jgi:hypothetical protein
LIERLIETQYIHEVNEFHTLHRWLKQLLETTDVGNPYGTRATTNMLAGLVPQGIIIHEIISIDDDGSSFRPLN